MDTLKKRLKYQSWHRGTRENDLILGRFAEECLDMFSLEELQAYEALLEQTDMEIYVWVARGIDTMPESLKKIIKEIRAFYK